MSLGSRTTKGGAKAGKDKAQDKGKSADKPQPKEKAKPQATTEQLRMAIMIDRKSDDASDVRRMVLELMEMTCRTEEEVCSALHDTDNDMDAACNMLLEDQRIQGEWQTNEKKKKKPPAPANNGEPEATREPRSRSGGPRPRTGPKDGSPGRGRSSMRGRGARRGARGGRGGGGGGRRGLPRRGGNTWSEHAGNGNNMGDSFPATEDWDNEEWSGSLSDTKVFTPSVSIQNSAPEVDQQAATNNVSAEDWDCESNGQETTHIPSYTYPHQPLHHPPADQLQSASQLNSHPAGVTATAPAKSETATIDNNYHSAHHQPMGMSGTLTAAQSQYLSQLTQQSQRHQDHSVYTTNYGVYGSADISQRKPQRARVPPPSKIPSSAVEMPGESSGAIFLDVQFGALEPDTLQDAAPPKQVTSAPEPVPAVTSQPETTTETRNNAYPTTNSMVSHQLSENLSAADTTPAPSQPSAVSTESTVVTNAATLEKQLSTSMKQLSVSHAHTHAEHDTPAPTHPQPAAAQPASVYPHHRPKTVGQQQQQQNVYAHHAVSHHPPVYGANVYAPQVNSTNASLTGASAMTATGYPSSVTLTQYQPMINSYQVNQTSSSAGVYGGSALYTAAPYTAYQPTPQHKLQTKEQTQYDSSVASSNSLTNTSTTQSATAKVVTTTVSAVTATGTAAGAGVGAYGSAGAGALYSAGAAPYAPYDEQLMHTQHGHHMGGYYEVGYGVSGAREGTFGLGAGERFGRTDAASPQQVPAALPPGYAYFYQPPPTTYQYGVYPTYGGTSNVGGVGGVAGAGAGKVGSYQQQQPYGADDSYKPGGPYNANANKTAGGATADLTNAMYAKTHVTLNKVNSYEKAAFHSGTPPPFGAASHLYLPAPPHHPHHHPQLAPHTQESGAGGGRSGAAKPAPSKSAYSQNYWAPN